MNNYNNNFKAINFFYDDEFVNNPIVNFHDEFIDENIDEFVDEFVNEFDNKNVDEFDVDNFNDEFDNVIIQ